MTPPSGFFTRRREPETGASQLSVTLDQIHAFDANPRKRRNPCYDEIKDSIRERGLDNPPVLTQRPGETDYLIASGGNTRLAILNELWEETHDDRFWRLSCPFRPWPETQGEAQCLIGHLAENDLRGELTFIERALAVQQLRELYQQTAEETFSQRGLAQRLTQEGYPISQSHISKMEQTIVWLLPCIPDMLYAGLGRHAIERLLTLRSHAFQLWNRHTDNQCEEEFSPLFQQVLTPFDNDPDGLVLAHVQDELAARLSQLSGQDYDMLAQELDEQQIKRRILLGEPPTLTLWQPESATENITPADTTDMRLPPPQAEERQTSGEGIMHGDLPPQIHQLFHTVAGSFGLEQHVIADRSKVVGFSLSPLDENAPSRTRACWQILNAIAEDDTSGFPALHFLLSPEHDDQQVESLMQLIRLRRNVYPTSPDAGEDQ
ncbi:chromosome partitioning protein ParB [Salmonella enterica]|nr:chromosome partitioning protein ParB [Salmonella enterica]